MSQQHTLYAIPHSLYSGRARSYLIKNNIPFRELSTGHESFKSEVLTKAKLPTIPTLVSPGGEVIRDGAAIIEYFEAANGRRNQPHTARQQIVSALFDLIGTDGLLRPAMHYRWNFPEENLDFLHFHFYHSQRDLPNRAEKTERMMNRMRTVAGIWGVSHDSAPTVESLYLDFLRALNTHFESVPYLLGWKPCIGDFGLIGPLYAHLGRDPMPARLMQQQAVRVYRWVERMNRADQDAPEYFNAGDEFLPGDEVPETLLAVLRILAEDLVPETQAAAATINEWLQQNTPPPGTTAERFMGQYRFTVRGMEITSVAQPYRFFMLQRVQGIYDDLCSDDQTAVDAMLQSCGMSALISARLERRVRFAENLEIWQ